MLTLGRASFCLFLLLCAVVWAHPAAESEVLLDFEGARVLMEVRLPIVELEAGFKQSLASLPEREVARHHDALMAYVGARVHPVAPDGRPWSVQVLDCAYREPDVELHLVLVPPAGAPPDRLTLNYDVIVREVASHGALVTVRGDSSKDLGTVRGGATSLVIDRSQGSSWHGFFGLVKMGMQHIAEGTDHVLFLLTLLLPAPLLCVGGRWAGPRPVRAGLWAVVGIVTAFTVGHSVTLALGTWGAPLPPSRWVEVLIALSIAVSACHALRPLFPRREALLAGGFGLIHGMAFSTVLRELGLRGASLAWALLGFNVGIELMQLAIVLVVAPVLFGLSRTRLYPAVRVLGGCLSLGMALFWVVQRLR